MELLKKFKEAAIILSLIGCLIVLLFSGCDGRSKSLLTQYEERNVIKDSQGNQYKIVFESKFPKGYGCDIVIYKSGDEGKTWEKAGFISPPTETYSAWGGSLAIDKKNNLYLSWSASSIRAETQADLARQFKAIFCSWSYDGGKSWSTPVIVNNKENTGLHPVIFVDSQGIIYISWKSGDIILLTPLKMVGKTWGKPYQMRAGNDPCFSEDKEGIIYLTYVGGKKQNIIYLSYSPDQGRTWHTETTGELPLMVKEPYVSHVGNSIYLIFQGAVPTVAHLIPGTTLDYQIYYLESDDRGKSWSKMIKLKRGGEK